MTDDSLPHDSEDETRSGPHPETGFSEPLIVGVDETQLGPEPIPEDHRPLETPGEDEEPLPADLIVRERNSGDAK